MQSVDQVGGIREAIRFKPSGFIDIVFNDFRVKVSVREPVECKRHEFLFVKPLTKRC